jgi:hypothetical protein
LNGGFRPPAQKAILHKNAAFLKKGGTQKAFVNLFKRF